MVAKLTCLADEARNGDLVCLSDMTREEMWRALFGEDERTK